MDIYSQSNIDNLHAKSRLKSMPCSVLKTLLEILFWMGSSQEKSRVIKIDGLGKFLLVYTGWSTNICQICFAHNFWYKDPICMIDHTFCRASDAILFRKKRIRFQLVFTELWQLQKMQVFQSFFGVYKP
jgi:hypothetical protein